MSNKEQTLQEITGVEEPPYEIPYPGPNEGVARTEHREFFWSLVDYESYECPDCGRGLDRVDQFDVHHIDGNPRNGAPDNLIALCHRCHVWRHTGEPDIGALDVEEWKESFLEIGN